jgi:hypothetical protein
MMLKRIVMQVSGLVMAQFTAVYLRLTICLSRTVKHLLALITLAYHNVLIKLHPLAQMLPSFKVWAANPTIAAPLIKRVLSIVKAKAIQIGLRLRIIARQTRQPVKPSRKKGK